MLLLWLIAEAHAQAGQVPAAAGFWDAAQTVFTVLVGIAVGSVAIWKVLELARSPWKQLDDKIEQRSLAHEKAMKDLADRLSSAQAQNERLMAMVFGKDAGGAGPGLAGIVLGEDHGGKGKGLRGEVESLTERQVAEAEISDLMLSKMEQILSRYSGGGNAGG